MRKSIFLFLVLTASLSLHAEPGMLEHLQDVRTGVQPKSAYFSPDGKRVFVPLLESRGVDVFQLQDGALRLEKRLAVPDSRAVGFVEAMVDAKRREVWISNMVESKAYIFDLDSLEYKTTLATGGIMPKVITQNPAGTLAAVSNWASGTVSVIDMETKRLLWTLKVGVTPRGMAFSPDGNLLYVAIFDAPEIAVVDMQQKKVIANYRYFEGAGAARHVIYRNGTLIVSDMYKGQVCVLDAANGNLLMSRRIGPNLNTIVLSSDGSRIYASSRGINNPADYTKPGPSYGEVFVLSSSDLSVLAKVTGRNQPTGLAISPDGNYLVFTNFLDADMELFRVR